MTARKDYVVWYLPGGGGFFVAWLLQIAMNPTSLNLALQSFPYLLKYHPAQWKKYENIPPNVGVLCNMLTPGDIWYGDDALIDSYVNNTLRDIVGNDIKLPIVLKYVFVNYIWHKTYFNEDHESMLLNSPEFSKIADEEYIRTFMQEMVLEKILFVTAPTDYIAAVTKNKDIVADLHLNNTYNNKIANYTNNIFNIASILDETYIDILENMIGTKLSTDEISACQLFIDRYIQLIPDDLLDVL